MLLLAGSGVDALDESSFSDVPPCSVHAERKLGGLSNTDEASTIVDKAWLVEEVRARR